MFHLSTERFHVTVHGYLKYSCLPQAYPTRLTSERTAMKYVRPKRTCYVLHRQTYFTTVRDGGSTRGYT